MNRQSEVVAERDLRPEDRAILGQWTRTLFGSAEDMYEWATPDWRVLVRADGQLVAHAAINQRTVSANGEPARVGGIGGVMAPAEFQGKGHAKAAMLRAHDFIRETLNLEFGFLLCSARLVPYYQRLGWERIDGPVSFAQDDSDVTWQEEAMVLPFSDRLWPGPPVDLNGPPW
ncbi:MAG TPA: GNAT family N-acetyltransferase [Candidatus Hydrogenedentes bacterium]|nr:GNAT family N-acetyltransferase [Candidatus Hydrogenedentota bacterium]MDY0033351.1 GNAT family N-acetyltransferase [FCB group bacterium]NLT61659.1 GNAT family N-acetyltransferase [Candidatus Hydrogenedentota bacterium]HNV22767.1 GNAT family N-acetyltransferase [Candidatus Hydrogenedentota bacterium]HOH34610.1 GNAT family N-acetyltransferase [Candidatus Hydrogenedentota bacterium]